MSRDPLEIGGDDELVARRLREAAPGVLAGASTNPAFREALFYRTAGVVRRRVLWRRLRAVAALLLAYGAGVATWRQLAPVPTPPLAQPGPPAAAPPAFELEPAAEPSLDRASPREIEERALASPRERRIELLRLAGDRYLGDRQEVDAALRCYRAALSLMRREEIALVSSEETWLFAALKCSRS